MKIDAYDTNFNMNEPPQRAIAFRRLPGRSNLFCGRPSMALVIEAPPDSWHLCCPLTGAPLTQTMAEVSGLTLTQLKNMVRGRSPLGISPSKWDQIVSVIRVGCALSLEGSPAFTEGALQLAVGGSAVACFSSAKTALEKKRFPQNRQDLEAQIRRSPLNQRLSESALEDRIAMASNKYESLKMVRVPMAPWFGIMAALYIEGSPDINIQIHSDVIDSVLRKRALERPDIERHRESDRLKRWHRQDVLEVFHVVAKIQKAFEITKVPVKLEFLGPGGDKTIDSRTDWWRIDQDLVGVIDPGEGIGWSSGSQ
jgi:hypothetical protein